MREEPGGAVPDIDEIAAALRISIGLLVRRMRQTQLLGELTLAETSALSRLDRGGPATSSELASRTGSVRSRWARRSPRSSSAG